MRQNAKDFFFSVALPICLWITLHGPLINGAAVTSAATAQTLATNDSVNAPPSTKPTFRAVITQYSRVDSCHTIKNGQCIMASGQPVYVGAAACPDFLALGTRVRVDGQSYICEDRYAKWLDRKRKLPTVDIFVEKNPYGNSVKLVTIES